MNKDAIIGLNITEMSPLRLINDFVKKKQENNIAKCAFILLGTQWDQTLTMSYIFMIKNCKMYFEFYPVYPSFPSQGMLLQKFN